MKIAIYGQKVNAKLKEIIDTFLSKLKSREIDFFVEEKFLPLVQSISSHDLSEVPTYNSYSNFPKEVDLLFTFGGDGTILQAATFIYGLDIPVVGVNTGRLGFLASLGKETFLEEVDSILNKQYRISKRSLINVEAKGIEIEKNFALNEVAVSRRETTSMITVEVHMNNKFLNFFWSDGLIISTPTGSTGYSLSCGGPIIHPETKNFVITPISPHNLTVRPLIIPDSAELDLKISSRVSNYFLAMDSRNKVLSTDVSLKIKKSKYEFGIIETEENTYLKTLHEKLLWGSDKRN